MNWKAVEEYADERFNAAHESGTGVGWCYRESDGREEEDRGIDER